ncbi:MAG: hypothetical protein AMXMBFR48_24330 [Ignavibacteriales bacterium]
MFHQPQLKHFFWSSSKPDDDQLSFCINGESYEEHSIKHFVFADYVSAWSEFEANKAGVVKAKH